ncbi:hypothetical protein GJ496_004505 [Pomphorhynchus laevis]|nr:hypothetical protein GJ496_004505 [Pomphorhynchus laevis]
MIHLALKTRKLTLTQWEDVLQDVLNCNRSLPCTSTNESPHDQMFTHKRRNLKQNNTSDLLLQTYRAEIYQSIPQKTIFQATQVFNYRMV